MEFVFGILQLVSGGLIVGVFCSLSLSSFSQSNVHPEDCRLPFKQQRIKIRDEGKPTDFVPRANIWAGLLLDTIMAIIWLGYYHYFGLIAFR